MFVMLLNIDAAMNGDFVGFKYFLNFIGIIFRY